MRGNKECFIAWKHNSWCAECIFNGKQGKYMNWESMNLLSDIYDLNVKF